MRRLYRSAGPSVVVWDQPDQNQATMSRLSGNGESMKTATRLFVLLLACIGSVPGFNVLTSPSFGAEPQFDVNDISYLWPVPTTKEDVSGLISADEKIADGVSQIWPKKVFDTVIQTAQSVRVATSAGTQSGIDFGPLEKPLVQPNTWKIVAVRVDPSAPGCDAKLIALFGSTPQIRLIVQPVTVDDSGVVTVHDYTAHLVFGYINGVDPPAFPTGPPRSIPDKEKFGAIVSDLKSLKADLGAAGVSTTGKLGVHPGLKSNTPGFAEKVKALLKKHLSEQRLAAVAFMGIDPPEPWIFFAMSKRPDGTFVRAPHPALGGKDAQMLIFRGGEHVMPLPSTKNVDLGRGVSTAVLFKDGIAAKLVVPVFDGLARPLHQDIPDIIANPRLAHFFNTDCVSCHSESTRRKELNILVGDGMFLYTPPEGISGVDATVLPQDLWNVRNFGWFPRRGKATAATVTMRTANEAAESAAFVNREYLGHPAR
jgi:hypothetical protein